jgi:hypothetical protein
MPYIMKKAKERLLDSGGYEEFDNIGEVNYTITTILHDYIEQKGMRYSTINDLIGVLECAKMELYRRIAVPYEDVKIKENGDVLGLSPENLRKIGKYTCNCAGGQK